MNVINKQTYTTTILDIEIDGEEFRVTHSEDFDDTFVPEYIITNDEGEEVEPESADFKHIVELVYNYMTYTVNASK